MRGGDRGTAEAPKLAGPLTHDRRVPGDLAGSQTGRVAQWGPGLVASALAARSDHPHTRSHSPGLPPAPRSP